VTVIEHRLNERGDVKTVSQGPSRERFEVVGAESSLTFLATSTLFPVYGRATEMAGRVEAAWNENGSLRIDPLPTMHLELKVEGLRTGNDLQDREMWKLIDSRRFPKILGDLRELGATGAPGRYAAGGLITLAGRARHYQGDLQCSRSGENVRVAGELNVDVRDFGLKSMNLLVLSVEPLVRVRLRLVARKAE
jgi:YceI-like domain